VSRFTDFWLSGRGKRLGISGAVDDCFISPSQHKKYICKYRTFLCYHDFELIGWAVVEPSNTLIHMLVAGNYRGQGIGTKMMVILNPRVVRSKNDQSSGNPIGFYETLGYHKVTSEQSRSRLDIDSIRPTRKKNIDILVLRES
jgi:GNAT superfamily N-acetyltransferase